MSKITVEPSEVAEMYHSGLGQLEIGEKFGVSRQAISDYMKRHGVVKELDNETR